ncbi:MAG: hypothetical protein R2861_12360 [Desulfobacterales bacterium]
MENIRFLVLKAMMLLHLYPEESMQVVITKAYDDELIFSGRGPFQ